MWQPDNSQFYCQSCQASISARACHIERFLESECNPAQLNICGLPIGRKVIHSSHIIRIYGGIALCILCGCLGRRHMKMLKDPCVGSSPPGTRSRNKAAYFAGTALKRQPGWPHRRMAKPFAHGASLEAIHGGTSFQMFQLTSSLRLHNIREAVKAKAQAAAHGNSNSDDEVLSNTSEDQIQFSDSDG